MAGCGGAGKAVARQVVAMMAAEARVVMRGAVAVLGLSLPLLGVALMHVAGTATTN